jgi:hypothetical protein
MPTPIERAVNFRTADLEANRMGHLSERQRTLARRGAITSLAGPGIIAIASAAAFTFARGFPPPPLNAVVALISLVGFGAVGVVSAVALWRVYQADRVAYAEGPLQVEGVKPIIGRGYGVMVGQTRLASRAPLAGLVEEGSHWRVYYTPSNRVIVSMEDR